MTLKSVHYLFEDQSILGVEWLDYCNSRVG